jgi:hypothetical protein
LAAHAVLGLVLAARWDRPVATERAAPLPLELELTLDDRRPAASEPGAGRVSGPPGDHAPAIQRRSSPVPRAAAPPLGASPRPGLVDRLRPLPGAHLAPGEGGTVPAGPVDLPSAAGAAREAWSGAADDDAGLVPRPPREGQGRDQGDLGQRDAHGNHHLSRSGFKAHTRADGTVAFEDDSTSWGAYAGGGTVGIQGRFDLTDWLMRKYTDDDPYLYEKAKFLEATREERQAMQLEWRRAHLQEAILRLPHDLDDLWRDPRLTLVARRQLLFQLWDDCAESGSDDIVTTARQVRGIIEGFVRRRLPAGSAEGYDDAELEELNAGRGSRAEFAPYRSR